MIGAPLRIDESTATLVHPGVAQVFVEVNLLGILEKEIGLDIRSMMIIQSVIYERTPQYCTLCLRLGHGQR